MRKIFITFAAPLLLLAALPSLVLTSCGSDPVTEEEGDKDGDKDGDGGGDGKPGSSENEMLSFSITTLRNGSLQKNINFTLNRATKTFNGVCIQWFGDNDNLEFVPSFTHNGAEVKSGGAVQVSGTTKMSFIEPVEYTVVAEDGTENKYTVKLFNPQFHSTIPVFRIEQPDSRIGDNYIKSRMEIIPNGWPGEIWDYSKDEVEIRLRGNSTRNLPKRPYRLKFPSAVSPLGLEHAKEKSWVLVANDCDKTLLRNAVSFEWARVLQRNSAGFYDDGAILFTPSYIHVNVYLGDDYKGVYQFSDQMQRKDGRIEVEKLRARDEGNSEAIKGGYVLEVDIHANDYNELPNFWFETNKTGKITIKYPDDDDYAQEQLDYIIDHVKNKAEAALYGDDFRSEWRSYFDEATAADYVIVNEFAGDPDAYTSIYLYKRRGSDKLYFGPVWDFDSAFDNDNRVQNARRNLMIDRSFVHPGYGHDHWVYQMWRDDEFKRTVRDRWNETKGLLLDSALKLIDDDTALVGHSIDANYTRWNISEQALNTAMPAPANYAAGIDALKKYINDRYAYLDEVFNSYR